MKLKLDGKDFSLVTQSPAAKAVREVIRTLPADELLSTPELMRRSRVNIDNLNRHIGQLQDCYLIRPGRERKRYWGKPSALAALREADRKAAR